MSTLYWKFAIYFVTGLVGSTLEHRNVPKIKLVFLKITFLVNIGQNPPAWHSQSDFMISVGWWIFDLWRRYYPSSVSVIIATILVYLIIMVMAMVTQVLSLFRQCNYRDYPCHSIRQFENWDRHALAPSTPSKLPHKKPLHHIALLMEQKKWNMTGQ